MSASHLIAALEKLITIQSTSDRPNDLAAALDLIAEYITKHCPKATIERFERGGKPSLLAYMAKQRPKKFVVLLNGHVDVVPGRPEQFKPTTKEGKLYGRGALDMKAAALVLTDVFCATAPQSDFELGLQIVTDEEVGGQDGTAYQLEQGVDSGFVVCGEFTPKNAICNESRGICQTRVTLHGHTAHSAYPWNGDNAILRANAYVSKLLTRYPIPEQAAWATTANVSNIYSSSAAINQVPGQATLELDIRYVPGDANFTDKQAATKFLRSLDTTATVDILMFEPAHYGDPKHPLAQKLAEALANTTNKPTIFIQKAGAADVRYYSARLVPAFVMGVQGEGLHADDEYLEVSSIEAYQNSLISFLRSVR